MGRGERERGMSSGAVTNASILFQGKLRKWFSKTKSSVSCGHRDSSPAVGVWLCVHGRYKAPAASQHISTSYPHK